MIAKTECAILAGGCFWGMQQLVRWLPGVVSTRVGYRFSALPTKRCAIDRFQGQLRLHCNRLRAFGFDSPKKRMKRSGSSMQSPSAIAAIGPNGEMGRESVADAKGT